MTRKSGIVVVLSTATPEQAPALAKSLVERRFAACVNILPVRSVYRWQEKICDEGETLLIVKTREENADSVIAAIRQEHRYDVPEIIVLPVVKGYAPYLDWVCRETSKP